jgi:hypothetical protein
MLPLFIDGTSNNTSNILARSGVLESLGYDVGMVFIDTSLEVALDRAAKRGEKLKRQVDIDFIHRTHEISEVNKNYFKGKFGFFKEVSNNPGELNDTAILNIYRQVAGFYSSKLENPVGLRTLEKLKELKANSLIPEIFSKEELKKKTDNWYRS